MKKQTSQIRHGIGVGVTSSMPEFEHTDAGVEDFCLWQKRGKLSKYFGEALKIIFIPRERSMKNCQFCIVTIYFFRFSTK